MLLEFITKSRVLVLQAINFNLEVVDLIGVVVERHKKHRKLIVMDGRQLCEKENKKEKKDKI
jgi:hypothetical protein